MTDARGVVPTGERADEPPVPPVEGLPLLLARAEETLRRRLTPSLAEAGLAFEHWRILSVLLDRPGLSMTALAQAAVVPSATLTRHVDRLVERAVVVRRIDPTDKRRAVTALSPTGQALAGRLRAEEQALEAELEAGLGSEGYASLAQELRLVPEVIG